MLGTSKLIIGHKIFSLSFLKYKGTLTLQVHFNYIHRVLKNNSDCDYDYNITVL